jgi:hypothetical protein
VFRASFVSASILLASATIGCGSDLTLPGSPGSAASISIVRGDGQEALAGAPLRDSLVVKVSDAEGDPVPGQQVGFTVEDEIPGAQIAPVAANTGSEGMAAAHWVLGTTGGTQRVVARVIPEPATGSLEARFTASATVPPRETDRLVLARQPSGSCTAGLKLDRQPSIQIENSRGDVLTTSGVPVTAALASGAGTLAGTVTRLTDENGRADFNDLQITGGSGSHILIFAAAGYESVTSDGIAVRAANTGGGGGTGGGDGGNSGGGNGGGSNRGGSNGGGGNGGGGGTGGAGNEGGSGGGHEGGGGHGGGGGHHGGKDHKGGHGKGGGHGHN